MKDHNILQKELDQAKTLVNLGDIYHHYKHPERYYQIITLGFIESNEEISVVYQSLYAPYFTWIRPLSNFTQTVESNGQTVHRFQKSVPSLSR